MPYSAAPAIESTTPAVELVPVMNNDSGKAAALVAWEQSGNSMRFYNLMEEGDSNLAKSYGFIQHCFDDDDDDDSCASIDNDAFFKGGDTPFLLFKGNNPKSSLKVAPSVVQTLSKATTLRTMNNLSDIPAVKTSCEAPSSLDTTSLSIEWSYDTEVCVTYPAPLNSAWRSENIRSVLLFCVLSGITLTCVFGCIYQGLVLQFVHVLSIGCAASPVRAATFVAPSATTPGPCVVAVTPVPSILSRPLIIEKTMESGIDATPSNESTAFFADATSRVTASPSPSNSTGFCLVPRPSAAEILGRDNETRGTDGGAAVIHLLAAPSILTTPITTSPSPSNSMGFCLVPRPSIADILGRDNETRGIDGGIDLIQVQIKEEGTQGMDYYAVSNTEPAVLDESRHTIPDALYPLLQVAKFSRKIPTKILLDVLKFFVFWLVTELLGYFAPCDRPKPTNRMPCPPTEPMPPDDDDDLHPDPLADPLLVHASDEPADSLIEDDHIHPVLLANPLLVHTSEEPADPLMEDDHIQPDSLADPLLVHTSDEPADPLIEDDEPHPDPLADPLLVHAPDDPADPLIEDDDPHPDPLADPHLVHGPDDPADPLIEDDDSHPNPLADPHLVHAPDEVAEDGDLHPVHPDPIPRVPVPLRRSARIANRRRGTSSNLRRSPRLASRPRVSYVGMC